MALWLSRFLNCTEFLPGRIIRNGTVERGAKYVRMAERAGRAGAQDADRRRRGLGDRLGRCHGLHLCRAHPDCGVGHVEDRSRLDHHRDGHQFGDRRLAGRRAGGPIRPRAHSSIDYRLVRVFHLSLRIHQFLRTVAGHAFAARPGLRRRVGGRFGADRGNDPPAAPRQGGGHDAKRMGSGLGGGEPALSVAVFRAAGTSGVAGIVLGRHSSGTAGALHPAQRAGTGGL